MAGTAGLPHVIVRFFTVPKVRDARASAGWALLFIAILYTTAPAVSSFSRLNFINTINNSSYESTPVWFKNWENTGLLEFDDKNADGIIQYVADTQVNELTIDNDIMVLANPEIANLPPWVIGLIVAGGLAAALSTAAGAGGEGRAQRSRHHPEHHGGAQQQPPELSASHHPRRRARCLQHFFRSSASSAGAYRRGLEPRSRLENKTEVAGFLRELGDLARSADLSDEQGVLKF